jgi:hypothetical protein
MKAGGIYTPPAFAYPEVRMLVVKQLWLRSLIYFSILLVWFLLFDLHDLHSRFAHDIVGVTIATAVFVILSMWQERAKVTKLK